MKIVLIGRGRLATNLERALLKAGHEVVSINSRTLENLPMEADAYIIAVKDSALKEVATAATKDRETQVFFHTAGSMPLSTFQGMTCHYGVIYPMQSFSKERLVDFEEIPIFVEASDEKTMVVARQLTGSISGHVYELSSDDRQYLHLAAVFACNFANHCYAMAAEILEQHGMSFDMMLPLIDETARKVHQLHPLDAQTGPAVRYDENVIRHQAQLLLDHPDMKDLYERMSLHIHRKAEQHD
jgi:predicted short-subunit dehydrogenase-like oxidoreductase (DUF2520 family)